MASNAVVYLSFHEPQRLRLSADQMPFGANLDGLREYCFDQAGTDQNYHDWLDQICQPWTGLLQRLLWGGARFLINVSGPLLQRLGQDRSAIAVDFIRLLGDSRITLVCSDLRNSIAFYLEIGLFQREMEKGQRLLFELTGRQPELAVAPLMAINDEIYHVLGRLGFRGVIVDDSWDLLRGRASGRVYRAGAGPLLLPRDHDISQGITKALGMSSNDHVPAVLSSLADKAVTRSGDFAVIGYQISRAVSPAAYVALGQMIDELQRRGVEFPDVGQILAGDTRQFLNIELPAIPAISAEYGSVRYFLGHPSQQAVFCLMRQAFWAARLSGDEDVVNLAVDVAQWDVLELLHRCLAASENGQTPHYVAVDEMERTAEYNVSPQVPTLLNEYYQNLVRAVTASYL